MPNKPRFAPNAVRRIEILAFDDVQLLDVAGPLQVFATANDFAKAASRPLPYEPVVVAKGTLVTSSAGLGLVTGPLPPADLRLDTVMVAGGFGINAACLDEGLVRWLRARSVVARRTASVCSGAFLLAVAGLLDGRRAVTHWGRCAEFARRFPTIRVEADPIFIQDEHLWTSAGITAGIDLALAMVESDLGREVALAVARQLVVFLKRPGGQAQYSATLALQKGDARFERLHAWVADNLGADLSVGSLAAMAGMSERSFVRHHARATGETPARAVERIRTEAARRLLEAERPIKRVATLAGFGSEETMRRGFLRLLGVTPQAYRSRFSSSVVAMEED